MSRGARTTPASWSHRAGCVSSRRNLPLRVVPRPFSDTLHVATGVYIVAVRNDLVAGDAGGQFVWPELPDLKPTIGAILHGESDGGATVDLEPYRLSRHQWERLVRHKPAGHQWDTYRLRPTFCMYATRSHLLFVL